MLWRCAECVVLRCVLLCGAVRSYTASLSRSLWSYYCAPSVSLRAVASGTFLYVGLVEMLIPELSGRTDRFLKFTVLLGGSVLMAWMEMHAD